MSGVVTAVVAVTAVTAGASIYAAERNAAMQEKAQKQQEKAQAEALDQAQAEKRKSQEEFNRANRQQPDVNAILANAQQMSKVGGGGTMLTGPGGVNPNQLSLGKSTLLGG